jgi:predicted nucleic acid-binding protein
VIVVSDTSPLNYLVLINAIEVLPILFGDIHVPPMVMEELKRSHSPALVRQWAKSPPAWLIVSAPTKTFNTSVRLDPGETQALSLATELGADIVLMDDRKGRRVAEELGLHAVGTVAVLEFAAERKLLEAANSLEALRLTTFYITDEYIAAALERDAARKLADHSGADDGA